MKGTTATSTTTLTGSAAARRTYLVQMVPGAGGSTPLPTPDATGSASMSGTSGRVELVQADGTVLDRVGYGTSLLAEGTAASALTNTTSATRSSPCTDTDDNARDFRATDPTPENSAVATPGCTLAPPVVEPATIEQIQAANHTSPYKGKQVADVVGVVTAVSGNGFWIQTTKPDADPATSAGLFVFAGSGPRTVSVGDEVSIDGSVSDFRPGGASGNDNLSTTELTGPKVTVLSSGNPLPAPVVLGVDRTAPQQVIEQDDPKNVEYDGALFRPDRDAIDFYESLEGMRVTVRNAKVVGATKSFGEMTVIPGKHV